VAPSVLRRGEGKSQNWNENRGIGESKSENPNPKNQNQKIENPKIKKIIVQSIIIIPIFNIVVRLTPPADRRGYKEVHPAGVLIWVSRQSFL